MNRLLLAFPLLFWMGLPLAAHAFPSVVDTKASHPLADTIDPVIFCPGSQIVTLGNLKCDTIMTYTLNAFDDQGTVVTILLDGLGSGQAFPVGQTITLWMATDLAGNTATCSFSITVNEPMTQPLCRDLTVVNLNPNCTKTVKAMEILEGGPYGCPINYITEVDTTAPFGNGPWLMPTFNSTHINQTYQVRVTYLQTNARCFGNVQIKDNTPPVIVCSDIALPCAIPESQLTPAFLRDSFNIFLAYPTAADACSGANVTLSYSDVFQNLPCSDTTIASGLLRRTWSATDAYQNTRTCLQTISRQRVLANVEIPASRNLSCENLQLDPLQQGIPYIAYGGRQYLLDDNSFCEFDWTYSDLTIAGNCSGRYTIQRTWEIFDACRPLSTTNPKVGIQTLEVFDQNGPQIECPANTTITVQDVNCRAAVDLPDAGLSDACSGISTFRASWVDNGQLQNLNGIIQYVVDSTGTDTLGLLASVSDFPVGTRTLTYHAVDDCGKTSSCSFQLTVANPDPPVAVCETLLEVTLPPSGYLSLSAAALDDGSSDDCSELDFRAKLEGANPCFPDADLWQDTIQICCRNIGDTLNGVLRVYDITPPAGVVPENFGGGHYAECSFQILVTGTVPPTCVAPPNTTVSCEAFDPTLEAYGILVSQSCSVDSVATFVSYSLFDTTCSRGTITRLFNVFNASGQSGQCSQKIVAEYEQLYYVRFPNDAVVTLCNAANIYGEPSFFGENCELFTVTFQDEVFDDVPDACFRIERTWTITNWCTYDPNLPLINVPNPNPSPVNNHPDNLLGPVVSPIQTSGDPWQTTTSKINPTDPFPTNFALYYDQAANGYKYKQIIKVLDTQDPVLEQCFGQGGQVVDDVSNNDPQLWNANYWLDPVHVSSDICEGAVDIGIVAEDFCTGAQLQVEFQLLLDLNGDNVRETLINSTNLPPTNTVFYNNNSGTGENRQFDFRPVPANQKYRFAKQEVINGRKKTVNIRFNTEANPGNYLPVQLPYGSHKVKWFVTDGCGNESACEYDILIRDVKAPTVLCQTGLSFNINPNQLATVWVNDLLQFANDNCTPSQFLEEGLRKQGSGVGFPLGPSGNPITSLTFDCDEKGPQMVELWCRDRFNNAAACLTSVNITDNSDNCNLSQTVNISGTITTETFEGVADVEIEVSGDTPFAPPFNLLMANATDSFGIYSLNNSIPLAADFTITPRFDLYPLNGLTTFDLVLISKHILGIEPLGSPYKLIAADANRSNSVTTFDIVELRKLILGIYNELPANTSWRFVPKSYVFPNPLQPFSPPFPESIALSDVLTNVSNADFWGVKIGDVNNTVIPHLDGLADDRTDGTAYFKIDAGPSVSWEAGQTVRLLIEAENPLLGSQFTLELDGLEVLEILPQEPFNHEHFALFPNRQALTFAGEMAGQPMFSLTCRAGKSGSLLASVGMSSRITQAHAYAAVENGAVQHLAPALQYPVAGSFELFQNLPNPFSGYTEIGFYLPAPDEVSLRVFDATGRLAHQQRAYFESGFQRFQLDKTALTGSGVFYYQVATSAHRASRSMLRH